MSLTKFLETINKFIPVDVLSGKEYALAKLDPDKIYIENIRSILNVSHRRAITICETAVRQGAFQRGVEVVCSDGSVVASSDSEDNLPPSVYCWKEEDGHSEQIEVATSSLSKIIFYRQKNIPPSYTGTQLEVLKGLQQIKMAWIVFCFLLSISTVLLGIIILFACLGKEKILTIILGAVDGIFAWSLKRVISYLFPTKV